MDDLCSCGISVFLRGEISGAALYGQWSADGGCNGNAVFVHRSAFLFRGFRQAGGGWNPEGSRVDEAVYGGDIYGPYPESGSGDYSCKEDRFAWDLAVLAGGLEYFHGNVGSVLQKFYQAKEGILIGI